MTSQNEQYKTVRCTLLIPFGATEDPQNLIPNIMVHNGRGQAARFLRVTHWEDLKTEACRESIEIED